MKQRIALTSLLVRNYDEAIAFFVEKLGFTLIEDTPLDETSPQGEAKRWVMVSPPGANEAGLLLAQASKPQELEQIGNQCGGRVFFFLHTDDFWRDYKTYRERGVIFHREEPRIEPYGTVAVFEDICGNLWDLIEPA